jgi:hypothetical protein
LGSKSILSFVKQSPYSRFKAVENIETVLGNSNESAQITNSENNTYYAAFT